LTEREAIAASKRAFTRWGNRRIKGIKRRDVRAPIMANRTLALVRRMFNVAITHDWLETNPCT
jgi:hypothetical protein